MATDPFEDAEKLYEEGLHPDSTKQVLDLLAAPAPATTRATDAKRAAYHAIVQLCEHINRWTLLGNVSLVEVEKKIAEALTVDPELGLAHYAKGFLHRTKDEHEDALASFTKAAALIPAFYRAHAQKGAELLYLGFPEQALREVRKAIRLSNGDLPRGMFYWILGRIYFFTEKYEEAILWLQLSVELRPDLWYNRLYLASAYAIVGDQEQAEQTLSAFDKLFPDYTLKTVRENEAAAPNSHPFVMEGRRKFHLGLRLAGMPA